MKHRLPLLLFLLLALLPVSASAVGMVTEARYDAGKLVLTAYADDDTVTVKNEKPSDIVLLLEMSSSVNGHTEAVMGALLDFVDRVVEMESEDRIAAVSYTDTIRYDLSDFGSTSVAKLTSAINSLRLVRVWPGEPNIECALGKAKTIFEENDDSDRNKIAVLLYDSSATTTDAARNAAITAAQALRDLGAELFCVDYAAQAQTTFAAALATDHFNKTTDLSASGDFTAVLAKIVRQMGGTVYRPDETAELRATLSDVFDAPQANQIRVRAEACTLFPGETPMGWEEQALLTNYTVKVEGQTVTVTGFDYSANAVYKDGLGLHGARLVVEIPLTWSAMSGTDRILTNGNQATSGVYFNEVRLEPFSAPASVTFTTDTYTVVHQRADGTTIETIHHILKDRTDDLTTKVAPNYLYGGLVSGTSFANGENAVSFHPKANATYTIREVPDTYLRPYVYSVWREDGGQKNVTGLCLLTTADEAGYLNVGFDIDRQKSQTASLCDTVTVKRGSTVTDRLVVADGALTSDKERASTGQIGYHVLDGDEFTRFRSAPLTFRPYWITNDGVRVSGPTTWTCTHRGSGTTEAHASVAIVPRTGASSTKWVGDDG